MYRRNVPIAGGGEAQAEILPPDSDVSAIAGQGPYSSRHSGPTTPKAPCPQRYWSLEQGKAYLI
jgi:hypothetical protein